MRVRFSPDAKSHDGLCFRSEILKNTVEEYLSTNSMDMVSRISSEPRLRGDLRNLFTDLKRLAIRLSTRISTPLLIRGGGRQVNLQYNPHFEKVLDIIHVVAYCLDAS